eukprot:364241-Chlamydomonas_euryale.AAC.15
MAVEGGGNQRPVPLRLGRGLGASEMADFNVFSTADRRPYSLHPRTSLVKFCHLLPQPCLDRSVIFGRGDGLVHSGCAPIGKPRFDPC